MTEEMTLAFDVEPGAQRAIRELAGWYGGSPDETVDYLLRLGMLGIDYQLQRRTVFVNFGETFKPFPPCKVAPPSGTGRFGRRKARQHLVELRNDLENSETLLVARIARTTHDRLSDYCWKGTVIPAVPDVFGFGNRLAVALKDERDICATIVGAPGEFVTISQQLRKA